MKNKELFEKTVAILVKAYQNDTLAHGNCHACAVGNIVAANRGIKFCPESSTPIWAGPIYPTWQEVFMTETETRHQQILPNRYAGDTKNEIDSTGYSFRELARIEYAFETAEDNGNADDYMFNGLMSVVDTLMLIHEATKEEAESAKLKFVKI